MSSAARGQGGFTLMEVLISVAILGTAFVAIVGLQTQSLSTMGHLTQRLEAELWAQEAYTRFLLREEGYNVNEMHPVLRDERRDWNVNIQLQELNMDELPVVPVLPVGWRVNWVRVEIQDAGGNQVAEMRPLWARATDKRQQGPGSRRRSSGGN